MRTNTYDITCQIGPLWDVHGAGKNHVRQEPPEWPMYSYDRPAYMLWNSIARELHNRGWSDKKIKEWLQSKNPRWALDGDLGDAIEELGKRYVEKRMNMELK